jgi:hypothetical protein
MSVTVLLTLEILNFYRIFPLTLPSPSGRGQGEGSRLRLCRDVNLSTRNGDCPHGRTHRCAPTTVGHDILYPLLGTATRRGEGKVRAIKPLMFLEK